MKVCRFGRLGNRRHPREEAISNEDVGPASRIPALSAMDSKADLNS
jgi:hypothetical protein